VVRQIRSFDALFLMTTAIRSSIFVLAWSCMLLFMIQMLVAFFMNQLLHWDFFADDRYDINDRRKVFEYFGTFSRSMLSTFEMTLANWPTVTRVVVESYSEWLAPLFVLHKLTIGFAVIGIINGVFIQETFRVAANDDFIMMHEKEWSQKTHKKKMTRLFLAGDASGDGQLDKKEFLALMKNQEVKMWLDSMGLDAADGEALFEYMDKDKNNNIDAAELVEGVSKLKGAARSLDLLMCLHRQQEMFQILQDVLPELQQRYKDRKGALFTSRFNPGASSAKARDPEPSDNMLR
jgi:Ca2+-binding EF-hand superfamily protein